MKETLYTIPLMDAFHAKDECPFCFIERDLEQNALDFVLGTSYMESDIREETDKAGFCRYHLHKMFAYGNALGNALMLKTHYMRLRRELSSEMNGYSYQKPSLKDKLLSGKTKASDASSLADPIAAWCAAKDSSCYVCRYYQNTYDRYLDTFFFLYKKDTQFADMIRDSKGFCLHHFGEIMEKARTSLSEAEHKSLRDILFPIMDENLARVEDDIEWFINKFDYRYKDADWKNSKDAVQRGMQKLRGGYPADPPYQKDK